MRKLYLLIIVALMLTGCKHKPKEPSLPPQQEATSPLAEIYPVLADNYEDWDQVYMPMTASLTAPSQKSISGRINMKRNQWIHISLRVFGMEVVTAYVDQSEVWLVDKIHRTYVHENLQDLLAKYPLTIGDVQDCLLGQLFPPTRDFLSDNLTAAVSETDPVVLESLLMAKESGPQVQVFYSGQTVSPAGIVAQTVDVAATGLNKDIGASLEWNLGKAEWNADTPLKFKMPDATYEQIDARAFMK